MQETFSRDKITSEEKSLTVYFMLESKQKINHEIFYEIFGSPRRTFTRVIKTIRESLENSCDYETQIFYNRETKSFELVKAHFKINKDLI